MSVKYLKLSSKNQITLPRAVIKHFPGTEYFELAQRDNELVLRPARMQVPGRALERVRDKIASFGITEDIIPGAIREVRNKK
jgi:hypothetical protein